MEIKKPVAYAKLDKQNHIFSFEALKKMSDTKLPIYVTKDFDYAKVPIGKVTDLKFDEGKLIATIELKEDNYKDYCFRVGGALIEGRESKIGGETLVTEIKEMELMQIGLINKAKDVYEKEDE